MRGAESGRATAARATEDVMNQNKAAVLVLGTVAEAIRDLGRVPSGHLYARLMPYMSLDTYNGVIATLKRCKLVKEVSHELIWIGPVPMKN